MFIRYLKDESGATAVEYGLIVAVLSLVIVASFQEASEAIAYLLGHPEGVLQNTINN